jgi:hypothetical protein
MDTPQWVEVEVSTYFSWGKTPGQCVEGEVIAYDPNGGKDYNGEPCPSLEVKLREPADSFDKDGKRTTFEAGEIVTLTCAQVSLEIKVRKANPKPGDLVQIILTGLVEGRNGKSPRKDFTVRVARATPQEASIGTGDFGDPEPIDENPLY